MCIRDRFFRALHQPRFENPLVYFRVKLHPEGVSAIAEGLLRKTLAAGQQCRVRRQFETLAMPVVHIEWRVEHGLTRYRRPYRKIADFCQSRRMGLDRRAQGSRQQLRAQTDPQKRPTGRQGSGNPIQLRPNAG